MKQPPRGFERLVIIRDKQGITANILTSHKPSVVIHTSCTVRVWRPMTVYGIGSTPRYSSEKYMVYAVSVAHSSEELTR